MPAHLPPPVPRRPRRRTALLSASLVAGALAATPLGTATAADARYAGLVINEVYGAGGNNGANLSSDYVELLNTSTRTITLDGLTLQYRSSSGTAAANNLGALSGSVAAGDTFLVRTGTVGSNGTALPAADAEAPAVMMAAARGTVWLSTSASAQTLPTGPLAARDDVVDLVGFGDTNTYEGAGPAPAPSTTTSVARTDGVDRDSNAADFLAGTQTPKPASSQNPEPEPEPEPEPQPEPQRVTIAEIQGTGDATPLASDQPVVTRGVVTAAYPTGGFGGFYLQTAGTGGEPKAAGAGSDAVFVFVGTAGTFPQIGQHVEVVGLPGEFNGLTQVDARTGSVTVLHEPAEAVKVRDLALPTTAAERERYEGELVAPAGDFTVSSNFNLNNFGELVLAQGRTPLLTPTEVADPADAAAIAAVEADNAARRINLDDGSSTNFLSTANGGANKSIPLPWITAEDSIRVNAAVDFTAPVVLDFRNNSWKFQPTSQLTAEGQPPAVFEDTRTASPEDVGGDLTLATFNVLNYFTTTGTEWAAAAAGRSCSYFTDRAGAPVTNNRCNPDGPRGAADQANLERQEAKIVAAINAIDAGIVSLEEIENSAVFGLDRDTALATLVTALNEDAGTDRWAFVPSPDELPASEDVIRTAFIYQPDLVETVGGSAILDDPAFANARQPLAQVFEPVDGGDAFTVVVNHFKSKGDSDPPATGDNANGLQGAFNGDRTRQAQALVAFADAFAEEAGTEGVFLAGDFNSYSQEDPVQVVEGAGYTNLVSEGEWSYSFDGMSGSLDHVFANEAALETVTGSDIWEINAVEPISYEYSRFNYNATDFYAADPYRSSDHEPHVVGISTAEEPVTPAPGSIAVGSQIKVTPPAAFGKAGLPKSFAVFYAGHDGKRVQGTTYVTVRKVGTSRLTATAWAYSGVTTRMWTPAFTSTGSWQVTVTFVPSDPAYRPSVRQFWQWVVR